MWGELDPLYLTQEVGTEQLVSSLVALSSLACCSAPMATVSFLKPAKPDEALQGKEVAHDPDKLF